MDPDKTTVTVLLQVKGQGILIIDSGEKGAEYVGLALLHKLRFLGKFGHSFAPYGCVGMAGTPIVIDAHR